MLQGLLRVIDKISLASPILGGPAQPVYAHCDIPCGIYDPHEAQVAAHTVIRMTGLIEELEVGDTGGRVPDTRAAQASTGGRETRGRTRDSDQIHKVARLTKVKEEHAEMVKHELRVLWADYFKEEHLKEYPHLHDTFWKAMKLASKVRQEVNIEAAQELLGEVQKIAEIFWKTKGIATARIPAPYPSGGEIVVPKG